MQSYRLVYNYLEPTHMLPSLQEFSKFTALTNTLTNKELNLADTLCDKALDELRACQKDNCREALLKFTVAFLKLFVNCPGNLVEGLTKKWISLLRELQQLRNGPKQKYDYLIVGLLEVTQKHYLRQFVQTEKNALGITSAVRDQYLSYSIKGGSALRQFLGLLRKSIEREKDWSNRIYSLVESLFEAYKNEISGYLEQEGAERIKSYLKMVAVQQLLQVLKNKFQKQIVLLLNQNLQTYLSENHPNGKESLGLLLFMELRQDKIDFDYVQENSRQLKSQFGSKHLNCVLAFALFKELVLLGEGKKNMKAIKKIMVLDRWRPNPSSKLQSLSESGRQLALWGLTMVQRLQLYKRQFSKAFSYRQAIAVFSVQRKNQIQSYDLLNPLQQGKYKQIRDLALGNPELQIVLALICWSVSGFDVQEQTVQASSQMLLLSTLKSILGQVNAQNHIKSLSFWTNIYISFNFQISFQAFINHLFQNQHQSINNSKTINECSDNHSLMKQMYYNLPDSYQGFDETSVSQLKSFLATQSNTIQALIDLLSIIFNQVNHSQTIDSASISSQLTKLSQVFYQKLNIRRNKQKEIANNAVRQFEQSYRKKEVQKAISWLWFIYQKEEQLDLKVEGRQEQGEKVLVSALRKYFSLHYGKMNETTIRKWLLSREYLSIWCMLLCSYKVKSISQQFIKCDLSHAELLTFLNVSPAVVQYFVQYLSTKDKHKYRLQIFHNKQIDQLSLLDSSIPSLLRKSINSYQPNT